MERSGFTSLRSLLVQTFQLIGLWPSESGAWSGVVAGWGKLARLGYLLTSRLLFSSAAHGGDVGMWLLLCYLVALVGRAVVLPGSVFPPPPPPLSLSLSVFAGAVAGKPSILNYLCPVSLESRGPCGAGRKFAQHWFCPGAVSSASQRWVGACSGRLRHCVSHLHTLLSQAPLQLTSVDAPLIFIKVNFIFKLPRHLGATVLESGVCLPPDGSREAGPHIHPRRVAAKIVALQSIVIGYNSASAPVPCRLNVAV